MGHQGRKIVYLGLADLSMDELARRLVRDLIEEKGIMNDDVFIACIDDLKSALDRELVAHLMDVHESDEADIIERIACIRRATGGDDTSE